MMPALPVEAFMIVARSPSPRENKKGEKRRLTDFSAKGCVTEIV
jgi:hypothetical protein